jgi:hypothetical protein
MNRYVQYIYLIVCWSSLASGQLNDIDDLLFKFKAIESTTKSSEMMMMVKRLTVEFATLILMLQIRTSFHERERRERESIERMLEC